MPKRNKIDIPLDNFRSLWTTSVPLTPPSCPQASVGCPIGRPTVPRLGGVSIAMAAFAKPSKQAQLIVLVKAGDDEGWRSYRNASGMGTFSRYLLLPYTRLVALGLNRSVL